MYKVAINGFGRIGRNVLRACFEGGYDDQIQIVAINDLGNIDINAHLLRYDTAHGAFGESVSIEQDELLVKNNRIKVLGQPDPAKLPWAELGVDVVLECTGFFTTKEKASAHIAAGAKKVLLSAPGKEMDATIVHGVNHQSLSSADTVISNASCTTNCLASIVHANIFDRAVALIASGKIDVKPLISEVYAFDDSIAAYDRAVNGEPGDVKIQIEL